MLVVVATCEYIANVFVLCSFKERGARNTLEQLTQVSPPVRVCVYVCRLCIATNTISCALNFQEQRMQGVISASAGNHALALAYHGMLLKVPVVVVTPVTAPIMKV